VILRDPIHGLVEFEGDDETVVEALLATREVQRLRRVRQLGLTSLVFPGAEHSRFAHAVGAAHVMTRLLRRIGAVEGELPVELRLDAEARRDAIAAALLHDLGHGPFSHLFEDVMPDARHHEAWTGDILRDPSTEIHGALESLGAGTAQRVADLLIGEHRLPHLTRAVSSTLDVDRADYLLRDSHMTGARYGLYDLDWLLRALSFGEVPDPAAPGGRAWVLAIEGRKGLPPIEGFFLGRHFMYEQVYHHKATRAGEALLRGLLARMAELVRDGDREAVGEVPTGLTRAARGEAVDLGDYLHLDDAQLLACIAGWARSSDPFLAEHAGRLLERRLPKTLPLPDDEAVWSEAHARACDVVRGAGGRPDLSVFVDVPEDVPYPEPAEGSG
jgi:HD superfamily phosphohydrolase